MTRLSRICVTLMVALGLTAMLGLPASASTCVPMQVSAPAQHADCRGRMPAGPAIMVCALACQAVLPATFQVDPPRRVAALVARSLPVAITRHDYGPEPPPPRSGLA
ncbi:MAG: hypothetical protein H0X36_15225 [Sphingomonadaceae bacterium]|nr:hypothetical protein [Sphingomonadaceae bacterium]